MVVSSVHLRLLIFLLAILIPACELSSLAFRRELSILHSTYKSKQQSLMGTWHIGEVFSCAFTPLYPTNLELSSPSGAVTIRPFSLTLREDSEEHLKQLRRG